MVDILYFHTNRRFISIDGFPDIRDSLYSRVDLQRWMIHQTTKKDIKNA